MEEFEKWASRQGFIVDKNENGDYKYLGVQNLWVCWQAAQQMRAADFADCHACGIAYPNTATRCTKCGGELQSR